VIEHFTGYKAVEPMAPLCIAGWSRGDSTCGASLHGIVMFLMDLHVFTEFSLYVFVVVDFDSSS
jgi:hypothetical protein